MNKTFQVLPTGSGKTLAQARLVAKAIAEGRRVYLASRNGPSGEVVAVNIPKGEK